MHDEVRADLYEAAELIRRFGLLMHAEIAANMPKGGRNHWTSTLPTSWPAELHHHVAKLDLAIAGKDTAKIREHAADVANGCLMLLDGTGLL